MALKCYWLDWQESGLCRVCIVCGDANCKQIHLMHKIVLKIFLANQMYENVLTQFSRYSVCISYGRIINWRCSKFMNCYVKQPEFPWLYEKFKVSTELLPTRTVDETIIVWIEGIGTPSSVLALWNAVVKVFV